MNALNGLYADGELVSNASEHVSQKGCDNNYSEPIKCYIISKYDTFIDKWVLSCTDLDENWWENTFSEDEVMGYIEELVKPANVQNKADAMTMFCERIKAAFICPKAKFALKPLKLCRSTNDDDDDDDDSDANQFTQISITISLNPGCFFWCEQITSFSFILVKLPQDESAEKIERFRGAMFSALKENARVIEELKREVNELKRKLVLQAPQPTTTPASAPLVALSFNGKKRRLSGGDSITTTSSSLHRKQSTSSSLPKPIKSKRSRPMGAKIKPQP